MQFLEPFLIGESLSMDAFAVSIALAVASGGNVPRAKLLTAAALFGLFQMLMPLLGWEGGIVMHRLAETLGPVLASAILAAIGLKMLFDGLRPEPERNEETSPGYWHILLLAVATSIDALFVGVSHGCLGCARILPNATLYGAVTFLMALLGIVIGRFFGRIFGNRCGILSGLVLLGIAVKILLSR